MKLFISIILLFTIVNCEKVKSQETTKSTHRVVFYNYNEFNSRISMIFSSDTMDVVLTNVGDSLFSYSSSGYFGFNLTVDRYKREADFQSDAYDEMSKSKKGTFKVKQLINKNFEEENKKYLVYRLLIHSSEVENSAALVFWCKEYGILMQKSLTTNGLIRFEFADDAVRNEMVRHLCFFIFSDTEFSYLKDWESKIIE